MTTWDNIYKNFQKGGVAWATLSEEIDTRFIEFIKKNTFSTKNALDVGVGTGKYLAFLETQGFSVTGIDSSPTAMELSKSSLSQKANLQLANMFEFHYPKEKFDLVLSVSTLHHGYKEQVKKALDGIYESLEIGGKIFITLPDVESALRWNTFKNYTVLAEGTFAPNDGPETGLAHSFYKKEEIQQIFDRFTNIELDLDKKGRWFITGMK
jgi:2-polyprenyl-3-methyl-5-hydroxy-6-metoxy-1,4-benzoquinol methylase